MRLTEAPVLPPLPPQEYVQLRDSIRERGVLQPLLITADHVLIDEG
jgi:ParB-like chromosome segregation protein Spo0J